MILTDHETSVDLLNNEAIATTMDRRRMIHLEIPIHSSAREV